MDNFVLWNPTKILFGKNQIENIPSELPAGSKVLLLYGGGTIKRLGILDKVKSVLQDFEIGEFGGIEPNPEYETLIRAVEKIRSEKYDFLLAVGGGSVIDGTKFIAAAVPFGDADPWDMLSKGAEFHEALPFATVLTLPATGSEMNCGAVITRRQKQAKLAFGNPVLYPRFSVLDPLYTYSLPVSQIGNGVVDTFVHVMEQYMTYPVNGKIQDRYAEGILLTLIEEGPKALKNPENYDVRANLMWAATMGLNDWIAAGVPQDWATHMIGHALTALYGIDHAKTLAVVHPALLKVLKEQKRAKLLQYAQRVWNIKDLPEDETIDAAIAKTAEFFQSVGLPVHLSDYDLGRDAIAKVIQNLKDTNLTQLGEHGNVTPEVAEKILEQAL